ncbi:hypothetical protein [Lacticaseibacillus pantheris]|jgi:hypothetical protein
MEQFDETSANSQDELLAEIIKKITLDKSDDSVHQQNVRWKKVQDEYLVKTFDSDFLGYNEYFHSFAALRITLALKKTN